MQNIKIFIAALALALSAGILAGCAAAPGNSSTGEAEKKTAGISDVVTVQVGTMGTYSPFSYYDDNGNLTGYDIEVVRLIEETDPSLHFTFISGAWESLFVGLDSDKFQMLANQISITEEREEKYALSGYAYHTAVNQIIVRGDRDDIQSFEDLIGKTIGLTVGDAHNLVAETWNEQHGNVLTIRYYGEDITTILQDIVNGRIDATLNAPEVAVKKAEIQGLDVKPVGTPLEETPIYFIFKQDAQDQVIRDKVDAALKQLIDNGKLSELSVAWFGDDYIPEN